MKKILKHVIIGVYCFAILTALNLSACKKTDSKSDKEHIVSNFSIKNEIKVADVSSEIKNADAVNFLMQVQSLDTKNGTLSTFNETDSLVFYKFRYTNADKTLVLFYFENSNRYEIFNFEHTIDELNKERVQIILSDYKNAPISVENYERKKFIGFSEPNFNLTDKTVARKAEETCYQCVNRIYQNQVKKCSEDLICDIGCSINLTCKIVFAASALSVCSDSGKPCSLPSIF